MNAQWLKSVRHDSADVTSANRDDRRSNPRRPRTSAEWTDYFRSNDVAIGRMENDAMHLSSHELHQSASCHRANGLPWDRGAGVTADEMAPIARSLQAWQLGETSDGRHLRAAAQRYAMEVGDSDFLVAVDLFIREEQRHGEMLGRFLDLAGAGRIPSDWGDRLFRAARYCLRSMEVWTTPVVMVETLAVVYYNAIRRATESPLLRGICSQILADEIPHLRFQCERLAILFHGRCRAALWLTMRGHRLCFFLIVTLVWIGHRRALRAGGYTWRHYWRASWDRMNAAWRMMDPRQYVFASIWAQVSRSEDVS